MKKIPSLFERDWQGDRSRVVPHLNSACSWVLNGEGIPTRKWDGTATMVRGSRLFKRYDAKHGKPPPQDWEPCEAQPDAQTGHWPGWVPIGAGSEDRWFREAFETCGGAGLADGTYEAIGPKIEGNREHADRHRLIRHGADVVAIGWMPAQSVADLYDNLCSLLWVARIEGIVWHHPDGRMAKIKRRDFGLPWPLAPLTRDLA